MSFLTCLTPKSLASNPVTRNIMRTSFLASFSCSYSAGTQNYTAGLLKTEFSNEMVVSSDSPTIPIFRIMNYDGTLANGWTSPFDNQTLVEKYKFMLRLSVWDSMFYNIQRQGRISFYIQNAGEEALQTGIGTALKLEDSLWCQYRELGVLMTRGFSPVDALNQLYGTIGDPGKGRQMPISYTSKDINLPSISTPLATQIPHASGAGYAKKLMGVKGCAVAIFGEGAASEGDFHAALNFAATLKSQTIFVCRNNGYAISTPVKDQYAGDGIAIRGISYGMMTIRVDGNDLFASYEATKKCREICVETSQPVCMEFMTYRMGHHSTSDDSSQYRMQGEMESWKAGGQLPIPRFKNYLMLNGLWNEEEDKEVIKEARSFLLKEIKDCEKRHKYSISDGLFSDVYDEKSWNIKEQELELFDFLKHFKDNYDLEQYQKP